MTGDRYPSREALDYIKANLPLEYDPRTAASLPRLRAEALQSAQAVNRQILHRYPVDIEPLTINSIPVQKITPRTNDVRTDKALLYHFGGGFVQGSPEEDIPITAPLACKLNAPVIATHYRLAPEHPHPAALHDGFEVYCASLDQYGAANLAVAGESAGGNLTLAVLNRARREGFELPAATALLSPWVDLTNCGASIAENDCRDASMRAQSVIDAASLYAPESNLSDPAVSPLFADYGSELPPTFITTGTRDLLMTGCLELADKLQLAGVDITLRVWDELWHVFEWFPQIPEARNSLREIADFIAMHLFRAK